MKQQLPGAIVIGPTDLIEAKEGVYYSSSPLPMIDEGMIALLKQAARSVSRRRARFCAHPSADADQHDMLIVSHCETYVAPHRHLDKSETFVVLEGLVDVILFDQQGGLEKVIKMGPAFSGRPFFYRMPPGQFHSMFIETELLVFLESTKGPFRLEYRDHAMWAPDPDDWVNGRAFIESVLKKARGL
jgi:cupin fold WbuC family metalloprotein